MTPLLIRRHVLMTADAVGGLWVHASSLAQELARRGWTVTLVTLGPAPREDQFLPFLRYPQIELEFTNLELEWQDPQGRDRDRALDFLARLGERVQPDIVHINGYREALAGWRAPVIVGAHSCVGSWWRACRGESPDESWANYLADISAGLNAADRWVAPTAAFRDAIQDIYAPVSAGEVIWNGIEPIARDGQTKEPFILAAGRVWDEAKNVAILPEAARGPGWDLRIAGAMWQGEDSAVQEDGVDYLGNLPRPELLALMAKAGIFVSPSLYEPFGLTVLEAAASGCALILSDIPTFRELWDGAAIFANPRDPGSFKAALATLCHDPELRAEAQRRARQRAARYPLTATADAYERLYHTVIAGAQPRTAQLQQAMFEARA
jgi:glycosyltransferase involved in cell wall biosynthesis